ncbi:MAG: sel1 repeat family protein, partial [Opitutales bacterium]|nr:sel1 repeat family protein [Opitutales bacterium]
MKKSILTFISAALLSFFSFAAEVSDNLSFPDFEKSLKREFLQDGPKFVFNLSVSDDFKFMIVGDVNRGANMFLSSAVFVFISQDELGKLLPVLKEGAEIKNTPCADLLVEEKSVGATADDVEFILKEIALNAYAANYMEDVLDGNLKGFAQKSALVLAFDRVILKDENADLYISAGEKFYEEIKGKNLLPEHVVLNFAFALLEKTKKPYYKAEYLRLLNEYKIRRAFNAGDKTFYHLFKTDDAEIKRALKDFVSANFKNSSSIGFVPEYSFMVQAFGERKNAGKGDFALARELFGELSKSEFFAKDSLPALHLNMTLTDLDLLSENPDYADIAKCMPESPKNPNEILKLAYVLEKLGGEENLKKSGELVAKIKNEKDDDGLPSLYILSVIFDADYAKFVVRNFGVLPYAHLLSRTQQGKEFFEKIKNDKSFDISKEDLMKIKMRGYLSDIEAREVQESPEDRKLAFKILKGYLENDKSCRNIGFLHYVLFCMCEGRNTEKDVEGAKNLLKGYLENIKSLPPEHKRWALNAVEELLEPQNTFIKNKTIEIKVPGEVAEIVKNYGSENRTANFCIRECKGLLGENKPKEALELYREALEKGYCEQFEQIDILSRLSKILSDDELVAEVEKIERGLDREYFEVLLDCRILEVFARNKKYSALVKYLNSSKNIRPFVKDEILATLCKKGLGVPKDAEKADELFKKAENLDIEQLSLMVKFLYEHNEWQDAEKSRKDFLNELLVQKNPDDVEAILNLAGTEIPSHKTPEKFAKIDKLYQAAIHSPKYKGENLRYIYRFYALEGRPSSDYKKAFELVNIVSNIKDSRYRSEAMQRLATHYLCGIGVEKDEKKGVEILNEIIADPNLGEKSYAYASLIWCMENGIGGLEKDRAKIDECYSKISEDEIFGITASLRSRHSPYRLRTPIDREFSAKFLNECAKRDIGKKIVLKLIYDYASENQRFAAEYRDID